MSISAFQAACHEHKFSTSFCTTKTENVLPPSSQPEKYVVRFWGDLGARFSFEKALQNTSVVFDPKDKSITFPDKEQLNKLDEKERDCASKLLSCIKEESLPIMGERVKHILGNTVVTLSSEPQRKTAPLSSQTV
ncbi:MAG: hypothetical protein C5B45_04550 [Chlamydiae bacterium]|nr:MAG: hypothetical protein C5B45_04550 [Chlamydiota bacterium]